MSDDSSPSFFLVEMFSTLLVSFLEQKTVRVLDSGRNKYNYFVVIVHVNRVNRGLLFAFFIVLPKLSVL